MSTAPSGPNRVLVVDSDIRVRAALTGLIDSTDGFTVVGTLDTVAGLDGSLFDTGEGPDADVAVVGLQPATPGVGLGHVRVLTTHMPVLAVAATASLKPAAAAAGAAAFCEMDGDAKALIEALDAAAHTSTATAPTRSVPRLASRPAAPRIR
jgi:DNA-binding NarL/FixJ family response regulator